MAVPPEFFSFLRACLMSDFSDNLPLCYACAVVFICRFAERFVLPFQRVCICTLFYFKIFSLIITLPFTFSESAKLRVLRAHVPTCLGCLRANMLTGLTCNGFAHLRAHVL